MPAAWIRSCHRARRVKSAAPIEVMAFAPPRCVRAGEFAHLQSLGRFLQAASNAPRRRSLGHRHNCGPTPPLPTQAPGARIHQHLHGGADTLAQLLRGGNFFGHGHEAGAAFFTQFGQEQHLPGNTFAVAPAQRASRRNNRRGRFARFAHEVEQMYSNSPSVSPGKPAMNVLRTTICGHRSRASAKDAPCCFSPLAGRFMRLSTSGVGVLQWHVEVGQDRSARPSGGVTRPHAGTG